MSRPVQRNVKRQSFQGRNAVVDSYNSRKWYQLADWLKEWIVDHAGHMAFIWAAFLLPPAAIALVLGVHALPLEFFNIPSSDNGLGLAAVVLLIKFVLIALAIRPLLRHEIKGWYWLLAAAMVQMVHSFVLRHGLSGAIIFGMILYVYLQVRRRYTA